MIMFLEQYEELLVERNAAAADRDTYKAALCGCEAKAVGAFLESLFERVSWGAWCPGCGWYVAKDTPQHADNCPFAAMLASRMTEEEKATCPSKQ